MRRKGFDSKGICIKTGKAFDEHGYNVRGFNNKGIHMYTKEKYDLEGYDILGFNIYGNHYITNMKVNPKGFTKDGWNRVGFNLFTGTKYDRKGIDIRGFNKEGYNVRTNSKYDKFGYDKDGLDINGNPVPHFSNNNDKKDEPVTRKGFNSDGICIKSGRKYNLTGSNIYGIQVDGMMYNYAIYYDTQEQYDLLGLERSGFPYDFEICALYALRELEERGFDEKGINKNTGTRLDSEGYDILGFDERGFSKSGYCKYTRTMFGKDGYDKEGYNYKGFNSDGIQIFTKTDTDILGHKASDYGEDGHLLSHKSRKKTEEEKRQRRLGSVNEYGIQEDGTIDSSIRKAIEFIIYGKSINEFCKKMGYSTVDVKRYLKYAKEFPTILESLENTLRNNSLRFYYAKESSCEDLLKNEISLTSLSRLNDNLNSMDYHNKLIAVDNFYNYFLNNDIPLKEYKKIFNIECDRNFIDNILYELKHIFSIKKDKDSKLLYEKYKNISNHKTQYIPSDDEAIGYKKDGELCMINITPELRKLALDYLNKTNEYVCYKTMTSTFIKIIKGELTEDMINSMPDVKIEEEISRSAIKKMADDFIIDYINQYGNQTNNYEEIQEQSEKGYGTK